MTAEEIDDLRLTLERLRADRAAPEALAKCHWAQASAGHIIASA